MPVFVKTINKMSSLIPGLGQLEQGLKRPAGPPDLESEQPPKRLAGPTTNYTHRYGDYILTPNSHVGILPVHSIPLHSGGTFTPAYGTDYAEPTIIGNFERLPNDQYYIPPNEIQRVSQPILHYPPMPVCPINFVNPPQIDHQYYGKPTPFQVNQPLIAYQPNPYVRVNVYDDVNYPNIEIPPNPMQPSTELIFDIFKGPLAVNDRMVNEFNLAIDKIIEEIKEANESYAYKLNHGDIMSALRWEIRERMCRLMQNKPILSKYNIYNCYRSAYHIDGDSELFLKESRVQFTDSYGPLPQTEPCEIFDGPDSASLPVLSTVESAVDQIVAETISHINSVTTIENSKLIVVKPFIRNRIYSMHMGFPVPSYRELMDTYSVSYNINGYDHELRHAIQSTSINLPVNDPRTAAERSTVFTGPHIATDGTLMFLANTALSLVHEIPAKVSQLEMMGLKWNVLERLYNVITGSAVPSASYSRQIYRQVFEPFSEYKLVGYVRSTMFKRTWAAMDLCGLEKGIANVQRSIECTDSERQKIEGLIITLLRELSEMQSATVTFHYYILKLLVSYRVYTLFEGKPLPMNLYDEYRKDYDIQSDRDLLSHVLRGRTNWNFSKGNNSYPTRRPVMNFSQNVEPVRPVLIQQDVQIQTHERENEMNKNTLGVNSQISSAENIAQTSVSHSANTDCQQILSITNTTSTDNIHVVDNQTKTHMTCSVTKDINKADLLRIHSAADEIINNLNACNLDEAQRTKFKSAVRERFYEIVKGKEVPNHNKLISAYRKSYDVCNDNLLLDYILIPQLNSSISVIQNEQMNIKCEENEHNSSGSVIPNEEINIKCEENDHNSSGSVIPNKEMNIKCEENEHNSSGSVIPNKEMNIKCEENEHNSSGSVIPNENINIKCEENEQNSICSVIPCEKINIKCEENDQNSRCSVIENEKITIKCEETKLNSSCSVIQNDPIYIDCEENVQNASGPVIPNDIYIDCEENENNSSGSVKSNEERETDENEHIFNVPYSVSKTGLLSIKEALNEIMDEMKLDSVRLSDYQKAQIQLLVQERIFKIYKPKQLHHSEELVCAYRATHNVRSDHETVAQIKRDSVFSGLKYTTKNISEKFKSLAHQIIVQMDLDFTQMPGVYDKVMLLVRKRLCDMCMGIKVPKSKNLYKRYQRIYKDANDIKLMFNLTNTTLANNAPTNVEPINTEMAKSKTVTNEERTNSESKNIKRPLILNGPDTANRRAFTAFWRAAVLIVNSMNEACRDMSDLDLTYLKFMVRERLYKVAMGISFQGLPHLIALYRQHHNVESDSQLVHDISTRTHSKKFANSYQKLHELSLASLTSAETDEKVKPAENLILEEISTKHNFQFQFYGIFIKWIVRYRICTIIKANLEVLKCNVHNVYRHQFSKEYDYLMFRKIGLFLKCVFSKGDCEELQSDCAWPKNFNKLFNANTALETVKSVQDEIKNKVSEVMSTEFDNLLYSSACTRDKDKATSNASGTPADVGIFEKTVRRLMHQHLQDIKSDLTFIIANDGQLYSSLGLLPPYKPPFKLSRRHIKLTGNPKLPTLDKVQKYISAKYNPGSISIFRVKTVMFGDIASNKAIDQLLMNPFIIDGNQISASLVPPLFTEYMSKKQKISSKEQCKMDIELNDCNNTNEKDNRKIERCVELTTRLQDFDKSLNQLDNQLNKLSKKFTNERCTENNLELTTNLQDFYKTMDKLENQLNKVSNLNLTNDRCADINPKLTTNLQDFPETMNKLDNQLNKVSNSNLTNEPCTENNVEHTTDLQDFYVTMNKLDNQLNNLLMSINNSEIMEAQKYLGGMNKTNV